MTSSETFTGSGVPSGAKEGRRERWVVRVGRRLLAPVVAWLLRGLARSWRVEVRGDDPFAAPHPACLVAFRHEAVLTAAALYRDRGVHVPVSQSRDGEHITAVMDRLGFGQTPRGSSTRGGVQALKAVVRLVRHDRPVAIPVDGPRGPAGVAKPGIVMAARLTGRAILPATFAASPAVRFGSWDRTLLPLPFARVVIHWLETLPVARDACAEAQEAARRLLDERIGEATAALECELEAAARARRQTPGNRRTSPP